MKMFYDFDVYRVKKALSGNEFYKMCCYLKSAQNVFNEMMARSRELEYVLGSVELATKLADSARDY